MKMRRAADFGDNSWSRSSHHDKQPLSLYFHIVLLCLLINCSSTNISFSHFTRIKQYKRNKYCIYSEGMCFFSFPLSLTLFISSFLLLPLFASFYSLSCLSIPLVSSCFSVSRISAAVQHSYQFSVRGVSVLLLLTVTQIVSDRFYKIKS